MSKKDTDDVLDFINSLPDSSPGTPVPKKDKAEGSEDFLEFLDELSAHEKTKPGNSKSKFEPKKRDDTKKEDEKKVSTESDAQNEEQNAQNDAQNPEDAEEPEDDVIDPIALISSWWNTEGSSKVSSLWGSITQNAHQLGETTYQIASSTSQQLSHQRQKLLKESSGVVETEQILQISSRLNQILTTMSQQIKDGLIDKEDELLNVMLVYDLNNVDYLDRVCAAKFNKVMGQVEGGIKVTVNNFNHKHEQRESGLRYYNLDMFHGKMIDGEKLCFANLDSSIKDYTKITDLEQAELEKEKEGQEAEAAVEINKSHVFIAIQPITTGLAEKAPELEEQSGPILVETNNSDSFAFTMILKDITNNITIVTKSQPFPLRWARWVAGEREDIDRIFGSSEGGDEGVDPSEWVKEWIRDGLGLSFAVMAQEYVTKRMGL